ncbi:recombinase family protein, partial [Bradyrhizobium valentinum]|uniref:recombinase family protein n=1 Tax=Bradyrhizobium valentinum TaxID=1518501 RepID=UPI001FDA5E0F
MSHRLASQDGPIRAAQYLRMSSENQRYSTENQQNAIAEYAEQHGYAVVASYIDAGKSALSLKIRVLAQRLLALSSRCDVGH